MAASVAGADTTLTGKVPLPPAKSSGASPARYKSKSGTVAAPAPPRVAIVYLEGSFPTQPATNAIVRMEQRKLQFDPGVVAIQKGTSVEFPNLDDEYHSVISYSKPRNLDLGRYLRDDKPPAVKFDKTGLIELSCDIHEHMQGTILVLDTPYFTRTDTNGQFRLEKLPAGKHTVKAWLNHRTTLTTTVDLKEGETATVEFPPR